MGGKEREQRSLQGSAWGLCLRSCRRSENGVQPSDFTNRTPFSDYLLNSRVFFSRSTRVACHGQRRVGVLADEYVEVILVDVHHLDARPTALEREWVTALDGLRVVNR